MKLLRSVLSRFSREPSLYFFLGGGLIFALNAYRSPTDESTEGGPTGGDDPNLRIEVTPAVKEHLRRGLLEMNTVPPTKELLDDAVNGWLETEVLYREGMALGLDQNDPVVRLRVATKMRYFLEQKAVAEPEEGELEEFFKNHAEKFLVEPRLDFEHVFIDGKKEQPSKQADAFLRDLEEGASPEDLGDRFNRGRKFRRRRRSEIVPGFGAEFANALFQIPLRQWTIVESTHGFHIVRVNKRSSNTQPKFSQLSGRVAAMWKLEVLAAQELESLNELRAKYEVVEIDP